MRIALIQMPVLPDKVKNIQTACGKIRAVSYTHLTLPTKA